MEAHVAIRFLTFATWAFLFINSLRLRLPSKYPLVFAFIFYAIGVELTTPLLASIIDPATELYFTAYSILYVTNVLLTGSVLIYIYNVLRPIRIGSDWHLVPIPIVLFFIVFMDDGGQWKIALFINAANVVMTYLGIVTIVRSRQIKTIHLGWNLKMVLLAITVPCVFQAVVFMVYSMGPPLSAQSTNLWLEGASLAAWIILAAGMIEYSPPTPVVAANSESAQTNGDSGREGTVGNLSETRDQLC